MAQDGFFVTSAQLSHARICLDSLLRHCIHLGGSVRMKSGELRIFQRTVVRQRFEHGIPLHIIERYVPYPRHKLVPGLGARKAQLVALGFQDGGSHGVVGPHHPSLREQLVVTPRFVPSEDMAVKVVLLVDVVGRHPTDVLRLHDPQ